MTINDSNYPKCPHSPYTGKANLRQPARQMFTSANRMQ
jgi:hypothetical protein